jgi:hypothetical protein
VSNEVTDPDAPEELCRPWEASSARGIRDLLSLRRLVDAYARVLDRRLLDCFAELFTEDGELIIRDPHCRGKDHSVVYRATDGWERAFNVLASWTRTTHFTGNHLVRVDGDHAWGEAYCMAHEFYHGRKEVRLRVRSLRYADRYLRTADGWRFSRRVLITDWLEERRPAFVAPPPTAAPAPHADRAGPR